MMFTGPLEDRAAIVELNASYGDCAGARDLEGWVSLWAEGADWVHPKFGHLVGRAQIRETLSAALDRLPFINFTGALGRLEVQGERAEGRVWVVEHTLNQEGVCHLICGSYDDVYAKREGRWLFEHRRYAFKQRVVQQVLAAPWQG